MCVAGTSRPASPVCCYLHCAAISASHTLNRARCLPGIQTNLHSDHSNGGAAGTQPAAGFDSCVRGSAGSSFMAHRLPAQRRVDATTQTEPVDPYCDAAFDGIYDLDLDPDDRQRADGDDAAAYDPDPDSDEADERDHLFRDEEMGARGDGYAAFGDPFMPSLQRPADTAAMPNARLYGAGCSAPARLGLGQHHRPPVCFSMEADCRAAWAALQPDRFPRHCQPGHAQQSGPGRVSTNDWEGRVYGGSPAGHLGDPGMQYAAGDKMQVDGCHAGGFAGPAAIPWTGPPYAPQSTERRRRPRRKWDASVNYERITRRLELRFDAVRSRHYQHMTYLRSTRLTLHGKPLSNDLSTTPHTSSSMDIITCHQSCTAVIALSRTAVNSSTFSTKL